MLQRNYEGPCTLREHHLMDGLLHNGPQVLSTVTHIFMYFTCRTAFFMSERCWFRTSDLCRVEALK